MTNEGYTSMANMAEAEEQCRGCPELLDVDEEWWCDGANRRITEISRCGKWKEE